MKRINAILLAFLCVVAAGLCTVVVSAALTNANFHTKNNIIFEAEGVFFRAHIKVFYIAHEDEILYEDIVDLSGQLTHNPTKTQIAIPDGVLEFTKEDKTIVYQVVVENFTEDQMVRASITNYATNNAYITNEPTMTDLHIDPWTTSLQNAPECVLEMRTTIKSFRHSFAIDNPFTVLIEPVQ